MTCKVETRAEHTQGRSNQEEVHHKNGMVSDWLWQLQEKLNRQLVCKQAWPGGCARQPATHALRFQMDTLKLS